MRSLSYSLILPVVVGCAQTPSDDLLTHGITAEITAQADGDGTTTVGATFYVGNPIDLNFVQIDGSDQLFAIFNGTKQTMSQTELGNIVSYSTSFDDDDEGDQFTVDLQRGEDVSAPDSVATLPTPFTLAQPPTMASRAADLTLTWTTSDSPDPITWTASGGCINTASGTVDDGASSLTIAANTFIQAGSAEPTSCTITIALDRQEAGTLDPAYGGGTITGVWAQQVELTSNP
jgi:hypothetical protein